MNLETLKTISKHFSVRGVEQARQIHTRTNQVEALLGLPLSKFKLNLKTAADTLLKLEEQLLEKNPAAAPVMAAAPAKAKAATAIVSAFVPVAAAVAAPAVADMVAAVTDAPAELMATAAQFLKMNAADRLQFCQDGGTLPHAEFAALSPLQKALFFRNGGKTQLVVNRRELVSAKMSEQQLADRRFVRVN